MMMQSFIDELHCLAGLIASDTIRSARSALLLIDGLENLEMRKNSSHIRSHIDDGNQPEEFVPRRSER